MTGRRCFLLAACAIGIGAPPAAAAAALPPPTGPVILTITGERLQWPNRDGAAAFDMAMLERMPHVTRTIETPWFPNARRFSGPLLRDVLASVGAKGTMIRARALNDYRVDIPLEDVLRHDVILARLLDGKPMSVREKGPLFIIYPFDSEPALRNAVYFSRCAWQLRSLEIQ